MNKCFNTTDNICLKSSSSWGEILGKCESQIFFSPTIVSDTGIQCGNNVKGQAKVLRVSPNLVTQPLNNRDDYF